MKNLIIFFSVIFVIFAPFFMMAQVAISTDGSTPHSSSMLEVKSTSKGMLMPRMTTAQRTGISNPAEGLLVYDTDTKSFWYIKNLVWTEITSGNSGWILTGNAGTNPAVNFIGTIDNQPLLFKTNSVSSGLIKPGGATYYGYEAGLNNPSNTSTGVGSGALRNNTSGTYNSAFGNQTLFNNTTGNNNTAIGDMTLHENINGEYNAGIGYRSLYYNVSGSNNNALGTRALFNNTSGNYNIAIGHRALFKNTDRSNLVAIGDSALYNNGYGAVESYHATGNTAIGSKALKMNSTGYDNTAHGYQALCNNSDGAQNTASGLQSLYSNTSGGYNTANGSLALANNTIGSGNTASGYLALFSNISGGDNTAVGDWALFSNTMGGGNTAIGQGTLYFSTTGNCNIAIGRYALLYNSDRSNLVAVGDSALCKNGYGASAGIEATGNTALGSKALAMNTSGFHNSATGYQTLYSNTGGMNNTGNGYHSLFLNTYGSYNTALGYNASYWNSSGDNNTAIGNGALCRNQTGFSNVAIGYQAGYGWEGSSCSNNVFLGYKAGSQISTGSNNILLGFEAAANLINGSNNIIIGYDLDAPSATGSNQVVLGASDLIYGNLINKRIGIGTTSPQGQLHLNNLASVKFILQADSDNDNVDENENPRFELKQDGTNVTGALGFIGDNGAIYDNSIANSLYLVNEYGTPLQFGTADSVVMTILANARVGIGTTAPSQRLDVNGNAKFRSVPSGTTGSALYINSDGTLNYHASDLRLKTNIETLDDGLEKVLKLRGVVFNSKSEPEGKKMIGFIAQEVEQVVPELVFTNPTDGYKGVNYAEMTAVLVEAVKEQQEMIGELQKKVEELEGK